MNQPAAIREVTLTPLPSFNLPVSTWEDGKLVNFMTESISAYAGMIIGLFPIKNEVDT